MVFKAKKDGFRWVIISFVFAVFTGVSLLIFFTEKKTRCLFWSCFGLGADIDICRLALARHNALYLFRRPLALSEYGF